MSPVEWVALGLSAVGAWALRDFLLAPLRARQERRNPTFPDWVNTPAERTAKHYRQLQEDER